VILLLVVVVEVVDVVAGAMKFNTDYAFITPSIN
jgi:hypothetical protein